MLDVGRGGNERRELRDPSLAARGIELGSLLELVGERDRVDRLALRPERERRAVRPSRGSRGRSRTRRGSRSPCRPRRARGASRPSTDSSASRFCGGTTALSRSPTRSSSVSTHGRAKRGGGKTSFPRDRGRRGALLMARESSRPVRPRPTGPKGRRDPPRAGRTEHTFRCYPRRRTPVDRSARGCPPGNMRTERELRRRAPHRCGEPWGRAVSYAACGDDEGAQEPRETHRSRRREVESVLAEPRLPAAVRVPVGDDEALLPASRRRSDPRVVAARSSTSSRAASPRSPCARRRRLQRAHHAIDVVHGRPVVVADVDHDDRAERTARSPR